MIIDNGTIEFKLKRGGGIDPNTGYPIEPTSEWSEPLPCQYIPNNLNNLGRVQGERFTAASYTILIEQHKLPDSERVRIKDRDGKEVGEFSIISVEPLDAVEQIRIMV